MKTHDHDLKPMYRFARVYQYNYGLYCLSHLAHTLLYMSTHIIGLLAVASVL